MNKISMRDAFFNRLYGIAEKDRNVILVTADMGAPSIDRWRKNLGEQYFNVGIAEQNMVAIAAGLASEGKKPYTYAIAPFITSRCHEFIKLNAGLMKFPIKFVGCGAGFGYEDSGPTHHTTEDISIMRAIPNLEIFGPSDSVMAGACAKITYFSSRPSYIRLDREVLPNLYSEEVDFSRGFEELKKGELGTIVSTGNMVHKALEIAKNEKFGVIDVYRLNPLGDNFVGALRGSKKVFSLEEHLLAGGLGSIIAETILDNQLDTKLKRFGLKDFIYAYGGRENVRKEAGIGTEEIKKVIANFL